MKTLPRNWFERLVRSCQTAILGLATVILCVGMFGGFDFTDEGAYYLGFSRPHEVPDSNTSYRFFGAQIFALVRHNIVAMRFCTAIGMAVSTLIFFNGWRRFTERFSTAIVLNSGDSGITRNLVLIASMVGFSISPVALSYNFQNAFCLLAACGFLFYATSACPNDRLLDSATLVPLMAFGVMVGLQFFVKFSSSVLLVVAGVAFFLGLSRKTIGQKLALSLLSITFVAAVGLFYFIFFQSFLLWWAGIRGIAHLVTKGSYTTGQLQRYFYEFIEVAVPAAIGAWTIAIPVSIGLFLGRKCPRWRPLIAILTAAAVLFLLKKMADLSDQFLGLPAIDLTIYLSGLTLLAVVAAASRLLNPLAPARDREGSWTVLMGGIFLFVVPYIGSFGTSNDINQNCLYQLAPWFALVSLLLTEIDRSWNTRWHHGVGALIFTAVAATQFYLGYWTHPYRVAGSRLEQKVPTAIGTPSTWLLLSAETHDFVVTAQRSLHEHGFKPGDELLVFFDLPGFVFAMGGSSPGHHWYFAGAQAALEDSAMHLGLLNPEKRQRAYIVRNSGADWDNFLPYLRAAGLAFPENYQLISPPMISPFTHAPFEIWQPKSKAAP